MMQTEQTSGDNGRQLSDLIHDLRTPLTGIMGFAELLLEDPTLTRQNREYLQIILDESRNVEQILSANAKLVDD